MSHQLSVFLTLNLSEFALVVVLFEACVTFEGVTRLVVTVATLDPAAAGTTVEAAGSSAASATVE